MGVPLAGFFSATPTHRGERGEERYSDLMGEE